MKSNLISKLLKETSLEIRLDVLNEMSFITLLSELGFREDKPWSQEEDKLLKKLIKLSHKLTKEQLKEIKKWEKDGKPI